VGFDATDVTATSHWQRTARAPDDELRVHRDQAPRTSQGREAGVHSQRKRRSRASRYYYPVIVLALDSTTAGGSCALARDGVVIRELAGNPATTQAARLPADLMSLLDAEAVTLPDVDVYAVATGPGSFTGLRVGIATMQGLAFAAGRPLVGVSGFDALADIGSRQLAAGRRPRASGRRVATWVDAWRGEVYAALYEDGHEIEAPSVESPALVLRRLSAHPPLFIGDAAAIYAETIRAAIADESAIAEPAAPLLAGTIAVLAADAARRGHRPTPDAIRPLYVRRPDAELTRDARASR
jgi:tRNA threonylcarbamoyladenosine biosynthesis protein TsaB